MAMLKRAMSRLGSRAVKLPSGQSPIVQTQMIDAIIHLEKAVAPQVVIECHRTPWRLGAQLEERGLFAI